MKIIHSLWSLPLLKDRWQIKDQFAKSFNLFKLSYMYAKKLGYEVVLHTDDAGNELLKDVGYDRIELSLNDLKKSDKFFWASGKIRALELEGIGNLHIDGDVFLKSNRIKEIIEDDYSVLTQMIETDDSFNDAYVPQIELINTVTDLLHSPVRHSFNCGIICFKDQQLFVEYVNLFNKLIELYKSNPLLKYSYTNEYKSFERMLIVEQYSLPVIAQKMNKDVKFIINKEDDLDKVCHKYGFVHALGSYKYSDEFQSIVHQRIKQLENDI